MPGCACRIGLPIVPIEARLMGASLLGASINEGSQILAYNLQHACPVAWRRLAIELHGWIKRGVMTVAQASPVRAERRQQHPARLAHRTGQIGGRPSPGWLGRVSAAQSASSSSQHFEDQLATEIRLFIE